MTNKASNNSLSPNLQPIVPIPTGTLVRPTVRRYAPQFGAWGLRFSAVIYLVVLVLVPVFVVSIEGLRDGVGQFLADISDPVARSAIYLSLWTAGLMTIINMIMGTLTAYVLVSYKFPGKAIFNAFIDLPFAIPALVTGVMLVLLYGPQTPIGGFFEKTLKFRFIFAQPGIVVALLFISYPFVIRTVQPVLAALDFSQQEAAFTLGASTWSTFRRVILPAILPALVTGSLLSFARSLGEFGSIIVVAGNIPMKSQTAAVYIYGQVEKGNMRAASSISIILLFIAFAITFFVDFLVRRGDQKHA